MKRMRAQVLMAGLLAGAFLMLQSNDAMSDTLVSQNLGWNHYSASSTQTPTASYDAYKAFDGLTNTRWQAASYATSTSTAGWIEVDLGYNYYLTDLHLDVYSLTAPGAWETVDVYVSDTQMQNNLYGARLLHVFNSSPFDPYSTGEILEYDIPDYQVAARYLQVRTTRDVRPNTTNGFVKPAWREIEVYADGIAPPVPEPSTFILLGAGLGGFALYRRRMKK